LLILTEACVFALQGNVVLQRGIVYPLEVRPTAAAAAAADSGAGHASGVAGGQCLILRG
jgi:hypothetical protein